MPNRYFADISSNNVGFDAVRYRAAGHRLIAIKATQGATYVNPKHALWCEEAHANGLAVIHYHYADSGDRADAGRQAVHAWSTVKHDFGPLDWMCLDVERAQGWLPGEPVPFVKAFNAAWWWASDHSLVGYSEASLLAETGPGIDIPGSRWWVADYATTPMRIPWLSKWWAWQRTDGVAGPEPHECAGVGRCDVSVLNRATYLHLLARLAIQR